MILKRDLFCCGATGRAKMKKNKKKRKIKEKKAALLQQQQDNIGLGGRGH